MLHLAHPDTHRQGNLSDLELDLVEESCGSTWIETGVRGEQKVAV